MFGSQDLGIDLGTANTLVFLKGKGVVVSEPTVVAINNDTGSIQAVGNEARKMFGRTPSNITVVRPMKDGVIADYDIHVKMSTYILSQSISHRGAISYSPHIIVY